MRSHVYGDTPRTPQRARLARGFPWPRCPLGKLLLHLGVHSHRQAATPAGCLDQRRDTLPYPWTPPHGSTASATSRRSSSLSPVRLLRRIPYGARPAACSAMRQILSRLLADPSVAAPWLLFLVFSRLLFRQPPRARGGRSLRARLIRERCQRLVRNEGAQLVAEFMTEHSAAINSTAAAPTPSSLRSRRRAVTLARVGAMGRAMASFTAQPLAPESAATEAALRRLHPTVDDPLPPWLDSFAPLTPVSLPLSHVTAAFRSANRLSSAGTCRPIV